MNVDLNVDLIVNEILSKSLDIKDLDDELLDAVIDELRRQKDILEKQQFGMINALQEKGLPFGSKGRSNPTTSTQENTVNATTVKSPATQTASPSIAEQINFGGQFKPVNKKEKIQYFDNGQWDIKSMEKGDDDTTTEWSGSERRKHMNLKVSPIKERRGQKKEVQLPLAYKESKAQAKDDLMNARTAVDNARQAKNKEDYHHALDTAKANLNRAKENLHTPKQKIAKSKYDGYTESDNIRRKMNNISDEREEQIKSMPRVKRWGKKTTGTDLDRQVKDMKQKSKQSPVKVFTPEEIAEENKKRGLN